MKVSEAIPKSIIIASCLDALLMKPKRAKLKKWSARHVHVLCVFWFFLFQETHAATAPSLSNVRLTFISGYRVYADPGKTAYNDASPDWSATISRPHLDLGGTKIKINVHVTVTPTDAYGVVRLEGNSASGITFTAPDYIVNGGGEKTITVESTTALADQVSSQQLNITWKYKTHGVGQEFGDWINLTTTSNLEYVCLSYGQTAVQNLGSELYYTVVHLGCSNSGATTRAAAFNNTWSLFSGKSVKNAYNENLLYYAPGVAWANGCASVACLLESKNAECGGWGYLLMWAGEINGVACSPKLAYPSVVTERLVIKNWSTTGFTYGTAPYIYRIFNGWFNPGPPPGFSLINGSTGDLSNAGGIGGQNVTTPLEKVFLQHVLVLTDVNPGLYYDPSYGVVHTGAENFKFTAVFGFANALILESHPSMGTRYRTDVKPASDGTVIIQ